MLGASRHHVVWRLEKGGQITTVNNNSDCSGPFPQLPPTIALNEGPWMAEGGKSGPNLPCAEHQDHGSW